MTVVKSNGCRLDLAEIADLAIAPVLALSRIRHSRVPTRSAPSDEEIRGAREAADCLDGGRDRATHHRLKAICRLALGEVGRHNASLLCLT